MMKGLIMGQMTINTAQDRITAALDEFQDWSPAAHLTPLQGQYARGDRNTQAIAYLVGSLEVLAEAGSASPAQLADAVERALRFGAGR
jgi:hypothetical protein